eukprot:jgi/Mesvir1/28626/Mv04496-RA.2
MVVNVSAVSYSFLYAGLRQASSFAGVPVQGLKTTLPRSCRQRLPVISMVAVAPSAQPAEEPPRVQTSPPLTAEQRAELAKKYGFEQIGEEVPDGVTLKQIIESMPAEVFELNEGKAWFQVALTLASSALGLYAISQSPWYLLPLAWAFTGTAFTGLFVIGHDCAHKSFSKNKLVEDIVGTLMFMPLIYPYEPWRFKHDQHHARTNMLVEDTAWHPVVPEEYDALPGWFKGIMKFALGPLKPWASVGHWLIWHFDLNKYSPAQQTRVKISLAAVYATILIGGPLLVAKTGVWGLVKYWLMPWLGYHFWMSTFTMVHHTAPHIPFKDKEEWDGAKAQLGGTVHCVYPKWVEVLCHNISVHIPHHVMQRIPSYNLPAAHKSLEENWGRYMNKATFNWRLMQTIMTECSIYDKEENYIAFDKHEGKPSALYNFMRSI